MTKRTYGAIAAAVLVVGAAAVGIGNAVAGGGESETLGDGAGGRAGRRGRAPRRPAAAPPTRSSGTRRTAPTWEVEVTKPDGATVDVRLDASFGLVVVEGDREDEDGDDAETPASPA